MARADAAAVCGVASVTAIPNYDADQAEIKAGEVLAEMKAKGARTSSRDTLARGRTVLPRKTPQLADLGVTKTQSSRWQKLAALRA